MQYYYANEALKFYKYIKSLWVYEVNPFYKYQHHTTNILYTAGYPPPQ